MRAPTVEEILAKCPDVIPMHTIPLKNPGGHPRTGGGSRKLKWRSETDRIRAATVYAVTGSAVKTQEITGIPSGTIRQWKTQPWWPQIIDRIRQEHDDELDVKFTGIINKTIEVINDRLEKGDYVYDLKAQQLIRKPMGGKETAVVSSIFMDKRSLIREKKKIHSEETAVMDRLKKLAQEFEGFVKAKDVTPKEETSMDVTKESTEDAMHTDESPETGTPESKEEVITTISDNT